MKDKRKEFCIECNQDSLHEHVIEPMEIEVRNEKFTVSNEYLKCTICGEQYKIPGVHHDPSNEAYRLYREQHGMMQPEAIKDLRKFYGLTQQELAKLLGFGMITLSRYETGALQDETHDTVLQFLKNPSNMCDLVLRKIDALSAGKRSEVLKIVKKSSRLRTAKYATEARQASRVEDHGKSYTVARKKKKAKR